MILAYALATELLARNSPTVLYGEACKLIQDSSEVKAHLLPPFSFHTNVSATTAVDGALPSGRGRRNRNVSTVVVPGGGDKAGGGAADEVMLMRFFVSARDKDKDLTLWQRSRQSVIDGYEWTKVRAVDLWLDAKEWWMEGEEEEGSAAGHSAAQRAARHGQSVESEELNKSSEAEGSVIGKALSGVLGSFIGLTRGAGAAVQSMAKSHEPGTWSSGEVHGELQKVRDGFSPSDSTQ